ncbi:MAG: 50S ribosomal protein L9 [Parcubacteria group bacterium CG10_big_fil_rev_8_21_14_0_10_38_31]|nr:MAG: 50S ribosomal protein L9 [Parcubacteria group bacterium CG10_big_fil_rev_8_21_14_0_10_38_31]
MKVILLKDVPKVGKKYDVCNASDGFARNFLIARGLAEVATSKNIKRIDIAKKQSIDSTDVQRNLLLKNLAELDGKEISLKEKTNDKGHLFAGVHREEIAGAIKSQLGVDVPALNIDLEHPIKEIGEFEVEVRVDSKKAKLKVKIEAL